MADAIRLSGLDVPVLVHAFPDEPGRMRIENRRDSFCGKMSVCNNLTQYGIRYSLTSQHTMDPEGDAFKADLAAFGGVCRVVKGLRGARFGQVGARPAAFITVRYSEKLLERAGISVESIDLSEMFGRAWNLKDKDSAVVAKLDEMTVVRQGREDPEGIARRGWRSSRWCSTGSSPSTSSPARPSSAGPRWRSTSAWCPAPP